MQVLYLGRAPRTKETLPDFLKWRRLTRHPLVFRRLTGSQRTPGFWGVTIGVLVVYRNPLTRYACIFYHVTYLYDKVCYQPKEFD